MLKIKKIYCLFAMSALCGAAHAFDYDACVEVSQAAPYNMGEEAAKAVCESKRGESGTANNAQSNQNFITTSGTAEVDLAEGFRDGDMRVEICVGSCWGEYMPTCPRGFNLLWNSLGRAHKGAYHGRYKIRGGVCVRKET